MLENDLGRCSGSKPRLRIAFALAIVVGASPLRAQGLDSASTIDSIVDADVKTAAKPLAEEQQRIAAAIGRSRENAQLIRKTTEFDEIEIALLPDLARKDNPLALSIDESRDAISELRDTIEGSAIFFHALDSRRVLLRDVVAVEFGDDHHVTVFVAGDPEKN